MSKSKIQNSTNIRGYATLLTFMASLHCIISNPLAQGTKTVPVTYWDYNTSHPEFEGASCFGPVQGTKGIVTGLDADRKPTQIGATNCQSADVNNWFRKSPPGEVAKSNTRYCRDLELTKKAGTANTYQIFNHLFFPIDDVPTKELGYFGDDKKEHNFNFCMEMHATFKYRGGEVYNMGGDDDIWAFINGKQVIDLGGVHKILRDSVSLDAQASKLGLTIGNYYPIDFFFCERQAPGSDLELSTSIDLIPPDPSGYSISNINKITFPKMDTLLIQQGSAPQMFYALEVKNSSGVVDCANLGSVKKTFVSADWMLDSKVLPNGTQATLDGSIGLGTHKLVMTYAGEKDTLLIRLVPYNTLAIPESNPKGMFFSENISVKLSHPTPGVAIHYTTDGSEPTSTSLVFTNPILLTSAGILKAVAIKAGWNNSPIMTESFYLQTLAAPVADPKSTGFSKSLVVTLTHPTPGVALHFTTDGSTPTSASPVYTTPLTLKTPGSIKAIAIKAGWLNSPILHENYTKALANALRGYYLDKNGDGRIETAVIVFNAEYETPPTEIRFTDPFQKSNSVLGQIPTFEKNILSYSINPIFTAGTEFASENLAQILDQPGVYVIQNIMMDDSVGPGLKHAVSFPVGNSGAMPSVELDFTEAITLPASLLFPFDIKRNGLVIPAGTLAVESISPLSPTKFRFIFIPGSKYPIPTDSLRLAPTAEIHDLKSNLSNNHSSILVEGMPATVKDSIFVKVKDPLSQSTVPALTVGAKFPFHYSVSIFDNVGQFIHHLEGDVSDEVFMATRTTNSPEAMTNIVLPILPVSQQGTKWATGAYILKGHIHSKQKAGLALGPQGESLTLIPSENIFVFTIGYLR